MRNASLTRVKHSTACWARSGLSYILLDRVAELVCHLTVLKVRLVRIENDIALSAPKSTGGITSARLRRQTRAAAIGTLVCV